MPFIIGSMSKNYLQAFVRPAYHTYLDDIRLYVRAGKTGWSAFYHRFDVKELFTSFRKNCLPHIFG